jgi:hypothetical protein
MPRVTDVPTPSRRVFIGATTIGLLAAGSVTALAAVPGPNPDADLLAACAAFHAAADAEEAACGGEDDLPPELGDAVYAAMGQVDKLSPITVKGLRAKAGVIHRMLFAREYRPGAENWQDGMSRLDVATINFLRDLSREG